MLTRAPRSSFATLALLVAACGGTAAPSGPGGPVATAGPGGPGATAGPGGPGATAGPGNADAPVTATLAGVTFGFPIGTCEVTQDVVRAGAGIEGEFGGVDVSWQRDGSEAQFRVTLAGLTAGPPAPFDLVAEAGRQGTSWDVQVTGTTAVIEAHMANELPGAQGNPEIAEYDVTIRIDCAQRGFGGMAPPATDGPLPTDAPATPPPGDASIVLEVAGATYAFSYFGCPMTEPSISFTVVDASLNRLFVSFGEARVVTADGPVYGASGIEFVGSSQQSSWSGSMQSGSGQDEAATITITC